MARTDILKRIKDDKVIDNRIQKYRLHYDYLKTCLDFPKEFKVDKSKYSNWKLEEVKKLKFNDWWKKIGSNIFGKQLDQVKEVKTTKKSGNIRRIIERCNEKKRNRSLKADFVYIFLVNGETYTLKEIYEWNGIGYYKREIR